MALVTPQVNPATLRMALQAPCRFRSAMGKEASFPILWDSGASISVSHDKDDFVGPLKKPGAISRLKGMAKGCNIEGVGHVMWAVHDSAGQLRLIKLPACYAPRCRARLLSTNSLLQTYEGETIHQEATKMMLSGVSGEPTRGTVVARINPENNIPTTVACKYQGIPTSAEALNAEMTVVSQANSNLTEPEKELLRWHFCLGHLGHKRIQFLMRTGVLSRGETNRRLHTAASRIQNPPRCAACQHGKQSQRPCPGKVSTTVQDRAGILKADHLQPGQCVSVDHFVCSTKGRLFTSFGRSAPTDMCDGGCIFVDHASGLIHAEMQPQLATHETLKAKEKFEMMCRDNGVIPQECRSDNGKAFTSRDFDQQLSLFQQVVRCAGVGAHHHNACAERAIRTAMSISRAMMLHAAVHWPEMADPVLWPMAVQHAVCLHNHVPNPSTGLAPTDIFSKTRWPQSKLHDLHVWGSPACLLNHTIADGKKIPKWKPCSQRVISMGLSPRHASSVPLVLNPSTGAITTGYHVVFDDWFATVATSPDQMPDFNSAEWAQTFGDSACQYPFDEDVPPPVEEASSRRADSVARAMDGATPPVPLPGPPPAQHPMAPTMQAQERAITIRTPSRSLSPFVGPGFAMLVAESTNLNLGDHILDYLFIGFFGGLVVALVGVAVWKIARRGRRAKAPARITHESFLTSMKAVGELSVFRIMTKEVITASEHWFGEFGRKYLNWLVSEQRMTLEEYV